MCLLVTFHVTDSIDETFHDDEAAQEDENDKLEKCVNDKKDDSMNRTFSKPSQDTSEKKFKCENCYIRAKRKSDLNNHKTEIHNWCPTCFSSFITQERLILQKSRNIVNYRRLTELTHGESSR